MALSFFLACLVIELTPGPNMTYLALLSSLYGRKAGFFMVAGIAAGLFAVGLAAMLGVTAIILESPVLYLALRWGGVLYLLFLAWSNWRKMDDVPTIPTRAYAHYFRHGLIVNILNPKAAMFYLTVFPNFLDPTQPVAMQSLLMLIAYIGIATCVHGGVVLLADRARPIMNNSRAIAITRRLFSILLVAIAIWFFYSTRYGV